MALHALRRALDGVTALPDELLQLSERSAEKRCRLQQHKLGSLAEPAELAPASPLERSHGDRLTEIGYCGAVVPLRLSLRLLL